jgi:hypothetical protein
MELLTEAESSLAELEQELKMFDDSLASVKAKSIEIAQLDADHQNNTSDVSGYFKTRLKTHSANSSALVLHKSDLVSLESAADLQRRRVLKIGQRAKSAFWTLHSQVVTAFKKDAEGKLCALLDPNRARAPLAALVASTHSVHECALAGGPIHEAWPDQGHALSEYRRLRQRCFDPLQAIIEKSNLQLDEQEQLASTDAPVSLMAEFQPV